MNINMKLETVAVLESLTRIVFTKIEIQNHTVIK